MYENRNVNENLWKSIKTSVEKISTYLQSTLKEQDFQYKYTITNYCWAEQDNFINVSEVTIPVPVFYLEKRFSDKEKQWKKQKQKIEQNFQTIFKQFELPEQIYLAKPNPLLKTIPSVQLPCDNYESEVMDYSTIEKKFGFKFDTKYNNLIKFKFILDRQDIVPSFEPSIGLNFIEDGESVVYRIKCQVYICSELDYVRYVTNSNLISPSVYTNYLKQQLSAFFADSTYPAPKINIYQSQQLPFDGVLFEPNKAYRNSKDEIIVLNGSDISFDSYMKQTLTGYDANKKKIVKPVDQILEIQNKILSIDSNSMNLIYTNEVGDIEVLDLEPYCPIEITENFINQTLNQKCEDFKFQNLIRLLKRDNDFVIKYVTTNPDNTLLDLFNLIEQNNPGYLSKLNSNWFSLDLPVHIKLENKIYLYLYSIYGTKPQAQDYNDLREEFAGSKGAKTPVVKFLSKCIKTGYPRTSFIDKSGLFFENTSIERAMCLLANEKIKKPCIICDNCEDLFKSDLLDSKVNKIILDKVTLPNLVNQYGSNLITYLNNIPSLSITLINPNILECTSCLGEAQLNLGSEVYFRNLVMELLLNSHFDFVAVDFDSLSNHQYDFVNQMCSRALYCQTYTRKISNNFLDCNKAIGTELYYNFQDGYILPTTQPRFTFKNVGIKLPELQREFYLELYLKQKLQMEKDKQYQQLLSESSLSNFSELGGIQQKYLGFSNLFANLPSSNYFYYKQGKKQEGCLSSKLETLFHYILCNFIGGVFEEEMIKAPKNNLIILCSNCYVREQVKFSIDARFQGGLLSETDLNKISVVSFDEYSPQKIEGNTDFIVFDYLLHNGYICKVIQSLEKISFTTCCENYSINFINLYYEDTVENTYLKVGLQVVESWFRTMLNLPVNQIDEIYQFDNDHPDLSIIREELNNLAVQIENRAKFKTEQLKKDILARYNYSISDCKLVDMNLDSYTTLNFRDTPYMYPFKNFMATGCCQPLFKNLNIVDENGESLFIETSSIPYEYVLTDLGLGKIVGSQKDTKIVDICHYKPVVFDKQLLFVFDSQFPADQIEDLKNNYPVRYDLLQISEGTKTDCCEENQNKYSIDLKLGFLNGQPSMYSTSRENLAQYGLNYFRNVFVSQINSEQEMENALSVLNKYLVDTDISNLRQIYEQFNQKKTIKIPEQYSFFAKGNIPDQNLKVYPVTIDDKFFLFISGYLYHKQCYKLSKKLNLSMIETLYYKSYNNISSLRIGLMQLLKVVDVSDTQKCLNFFTDKHPIYQPIELQPNQPVKEQANVSINPSPILPKINPLFTGKDLLKDRVTQIRGV